MPNKKPAPKITTTEAVREQIRELLEYEGDIKTATVHEIDKGQEEDSEIRVVLVLEYEKNRGKRKVYVIYENDYETVEDLNPLEFTGKDVIEQLREWAEQ